jgi:hypothetical protein
MLTNLKQVLSRQLLNIPGWRTKRKIIVIESDDWGSIRMPSKEVYEKFLKAGIRVDKCHYNKYDTLASENDLSHLFETLTRFKDKNGFHPVITANTIVANPDFEKIKASDFEKYFYEPFTNTLKRYPKHTNVFELWQQGISEDIFKPQFHGREHLNVNRWLRVLQSGSNETTFAFENNFFGLSATITTEKRKSYLAALDFDDKSELNSQKVVLKDGLVLFERLFGYKSKTYIATNYVWHPEVEAQLHQSGIIAMQGGNSHIIPGGQKPNQVTRHKLGERNTFNQTYLIRNVFFEPSENPNKDWVISCLKEIELAFKWHKPAIISSHRVNYIGFINERNRKDNLHALSQILSIIIKKWPEAEYMSSDQLAEIIRSESKEHE